MAVLASDTFTRANVGSGWGTATDGNAWAQVRGTQVLDVTSNEGRSAFSNATTGIQVLGSGTAADSEGLVRLQVATLTDLAGIVLRFIDSNNFYSCIIGNTSQTITFRKDVAAVFSTVGVAVGVTYVAGSWYWMRFRIVGTTFSAKFWADGSGEPNTWTMTATDASIAAAGRYGLAATPTGAGNIDLFDSFSANDTVPITTFPEFIPRVFGGTLIKTFIPRVFGGTFIRYDGIPAGVTLAPVTMAGIGTLAGTFSLSTALTDTLAGVGTLAGTLSANLALASTTLAGVGTLTGTANLTTALASTFAGVGTLAGTFSLATALSDTFTGVGTLTGTAQLATSLSSTLAGVGTLSGTLSTTGGVSLTVSLAGAGTLAGTLVLSTALATTIAGVGTLAGTSTLSTALTDTLVGVGMLAGTLTAQTALTVTVVGAGSLAGAIFLSTALTTQLAGAGILSGVFSIRIALFLTCAGAGTLAGNFAQLSAYYLTASWQTRDGLASWTTRDKG